MFCGGSGHDPLLGCRYLETPDLSNVPWRHRLPWMVAFPKAATLDVFLKKSPFLGIYRKHVTLVVDPKLATVRPSWLLANHL